MEGLGTALTRLRIAAELGADVMPNMKIHGLEILNAD
jgi:hypothetical protein